MMNLVRILIGVSPLALLCAGVMTMSSSCSSVALGMDD